VVGGATGAEAPVGGDVPVLVEARAQALLIAGVRLVLALGALMLAVARGLGAVPAAGLFAFGCGALLFALLAGSGRRRTDERLAGVEAAPSYAIVVPRWRSLLKASYPSTIALTIGAAVALVLNPSLAAVLAGILAGLGLAALIAAGRVTLLERELHGRLLAERGRNGRIFLRAA
jgi:hypothetical protein